MAKKEEAAARALFEAGKDAAKRALEEFTLSGEDKAARDAERERAAKLRRYKWIAIAVAALVVVVALFVLIAKIWLWVILAAIVFALGYVGYRWASARLSALPEIRPPQIRVVQAAQSRPAEQPAEEKPRPRPLPAAPAAPKRDPNEEAARIERELAELKKKVDR